MSGLSFYLNSCRLYFKLKNWSFSDHLWNLFEGYIFVITYIIINTSGVYLVIYSQRHMCAPWYNCFARRCHTPSNSYQLKPTNKSSLTFTFSAFAFSSVFLFSSYFFYAHISSSFARCLYFLPGAKLRVAGRIYFLVRAREGRRIYLV